MKVFSSWMVICFILIFILCSCSTNKTQNIVVDANSTVFKTNSESNVTESNIPETTDTDIESKDLTKIIGIGERAELSGLIAVTLKDYSYESYKQLAEEFEKEYPNVQSPYSNSNISDMAFLEINLEFENISDFSIEKLKFGAKRENYEGQIPNFSLEYSGQLYPLNGNFYDISGQYFLDNEGEYLLPSGTASVCLVMDIPMKMTDNLNEANMTVAYNDVTYKWQLDSKLLSNK